MTEKIYVCAECGTEPVDGCEFCEMLNLYERIGADDKPEFTGKPDEVFNLFCWACDRVVETNPPPPIKERLERLVDLAAAYLGRIYYDDPPEWTDAEIPGPDAECLF